MIVSTSVFGGGAQYVIGARRQHQLARAFYPGWEFRIYTDDASPFADLGATVIEMAPEGDGCFWRFLPLFESDRNVVIVRDADSRITAREARAVREWMDSPHRFHIIRDHENHFAEGAAIIASMFGLKGSLSSEILDIMSGYMARPHLYGEDEVFLDRHVFPAVKDDCLFHCMDEGWFGESRRHLANPYEFVGNGWDEHDMPIYPPDNGAKDAREHRLLEYRFSSYPRPND